MIKAFFPFDVKIMLEQIKMICAVNRKDIDKYINIKINRLNETLNK